MKTSNFSKAYESVKTSILPLRMSTMTNDKRLLMGFSTGFLIDDNHVLSVAHSCFHDIEDFTSKKHENHEYMILNSDNTITYYQMTLLDMDPDHDIALFKIKESRSFLKFAKKEAIIGEKLACFGFSHLNYVDDWKSIYIQAILRTGTVGERFGPQFCVDRIMYPGYSGAPYVNKKGEVVGMQQRILTVPATMTPIDYSLFLCLEEIRRFLANNNLKI